MKVLMLSFDEANVARQDRAMAVVGCRSCVFACPERKNAKKYFFFHT